MKVILCDLDGTLADCSHRVHYVRPELNKDNPTFKKDWKKFFNEMDNDIVNAPLNEILTTLHQNYDIIFVTARPSNYYGKTARWLYEQANWFKDSYSMYMRKEGDFRSDDIVKKEILDQIIADGHEVIMVFDDRKNVVDMWRNNGVFCAQVADHDF